MKKTLLCATTAIALAMVSGAANAEDGWYVRGDVGYNFDGKLDYDANAHVPGTLGDYGDVEGDLTYGAGLGYGFDNGFRLEGAVTFRNSKLDVSPTVNGQAFYEAGFGPGQYSIVAPSGKAYGWDAMLNLLYDFNRDGKFQPYLGAGIGVSEMSASVRNYYFLDTASQSGFAINTINDSETALAYQALAGFGYELTERLTFDLGYRYFVVDDLDYAGNLVDYDSQYTDHMVTAGLRWPNLFACGVVLSGTLLRCITSTPPAATWYIQTSI